MFYVLARKPFVSAVRSGIPHPSRSNTSNEYLPHCKCSAARRVRNEIRQDAIESGLNTEMDHLNKELNELKHELDLYKRKVDTRDREIMRLNQLLSTEGRPYSALAKECCYREVDGLSIDLEILQKEKCDLLMKVQEYCDKMHEAMQRSIELENKNQALKNELEDVKSAAIEVEAQANREVQKYEIEAKNWREKVEKLLSPSNEYEYDTESGREAVRQIKQRINYFKQLRDDNDEGGDCVKVNNVLDKSEVDYSERLHRKVHELKSKIKAMTVKSKCNCDEDLLNLRAQRDFFQHDYVRMLNEVGEDRVSLCISSNNH